MSERINPYYHPEKLGLEMIVFDGDGLSYEYNTLCFWRASNGAVFTASDSGCSCPTPFDNVESTTLDEFMQKVERVGSFEQAERVVMAWNKEYGGRPICDMSGDLEKLRAWWPR